MPIYEYTCHECEQSFEMMHKISDPAPEACPSCGAASLKRLVSAPAFRLKGGGWYETDFKTKDEVKRNLVDTPDAAKSSGDAGGGSVSSSGSGSPPAGASGSDSGSGSKSSSASGSQSVSQTAS